MARKVLYLLTKPSNDPLIEFAPSDQETSVVLLQDAVSLEGIHAKEVSVLEENTGDGGGPRGNIMISYTDMLRKIFGSDTVVVL